MRAVERRLLWLVVVFAALSIGAPSALSAQEEVDPDNTLTDDVLYDRDGDGVEDFEDRFPDDPNEDSDFDWDGIGDNADPDDDNDNVLDIDDAFPLNGRESADSDGDGIGDVQEENEESAAERFRWEVRGSGLDDADGDGRWDVDLTDSDGDGYVDLVDPRPSRPPGPECPQTNPGFRASTFADYDYDYDGIPDSEDQDIDNDGVVADWEVELLAESYDFDGDGLVDSEDDDLDGDGVENIVDMFPYDPLEWEDYNCGGIGDNADFDADGDFVEDEFDEFLKNGHEWADRDGDGIGDNIDADDDNDGVLDSVDEFPWDDDEWLDSDFDGVGDNADLDDDDDGVLDEEDAFPLDRMASEVEPEPEAPVSDFAASEVGSADALAFQEPVDETRAIRLLLAAPLLALGYFSRRLT